MAEKAGRRTLYFPDEDSHELRSANGGIASDPNGIPARYWRWDVTDHARFRHELVLHPEVASETRPGWYVPRVYRGIETPPHVDIEAFRASIVVARGLLRRLRAIFDVVEPRRAQASVFGHEIRQLVILACTEVESGWSAVLKANGYAKERCTTGDYVLLKEPMKLEGYALGLTLYPEYGEIRPFEGWDPECATQSLKWYDGYNGTKHDREALLSKATVEFAIAAIAAVIVMVEAQFGPSPTGQPALPDDFHVVQRPDWLADAYIRPLLEPDEPDGAEWPYEWTPRPLFPAGRPES
jgi:hypothetical protein